jgi:uncharacterized protein YoxC
MLQRQWCVTLPLHILQIEVLVRSCEHWILVSLINRVSSLMNRVLSLMNRVRSLIDRVRSLIDRVRSLIDRVRSLIDRVRSLMNRVRSLMNRVRSLMNRVRSLMNRVRSLINGARRCCVGNDSVIEIAVLCSMLSHVGLFAPVNTIAQTALAKHPARATKHPTPLQ